MENPIHPSKWMMTRGTPIFRTPPCFTSGISRFFLRFFFFFFGGELILKVFPAARECHGRVPRGLSAGAQEFQRYHHRGTYDEGPAVESSVANEDNEVESPSTKPWFLFGGV